LITIENEYLSNPKLQDFILKSSTFEEFIDNVKSSKILFFDENEKPYGVFSNYYGVSQNKNFKLIVNGVNYKSVEHLWQSLKFLGEGYTKRDLEYSQLIANQSTPNKAKILANQKIGGGYKWVTDLNKIINEYKDVKIRSDWENVKDSYMHYCLLEKFKQNDNLKKILLSTDDKLLIENSPTDKYWGQVNSVGLNKLGELLMLVRKELKI